MNATPIKVLVIDDEPPIRKLLRMGLSTQGYEILEASNGKIALELLAQDPALIILDLGLPDIQGHELLRMIRGRNESVPIVVLSSRGDEAGKVQALDLGADDYLTKPFGMDELLARMRAVLRRKAGSGAPLLVCGALSVDPASHEAEFRGARCRLSAREFALVEALVRRPGAILSKSDLEERIYGWDQDVDSNTVEVLVYGLRRKLGPEVIRTVRGVGYLVDARP